jgi:hypothetical protein
MLERWKMVIGDGDGDGDDEGSGGGDGLGVISGSTHGCL